MRTNVRIGNDIKLLWEVLRGGQPVNLNEVTEIKVSIMQGGVLDCNDATPIPTFEVDTDQSNLLVVEIQKEKITELGYLWVKLEYTMSENGMVDGNRKITIDNLPVKIVGTTDEAGDVYEFNVVTDVVVGFDGKSAYEVWLMENPDKTLQDYFDWLQQPATDVAEDVSQAEALRVQAEALRVQAENIRIANEQARVANEQGRVSAENIRTSNEVDRVDAENIRLSNEQDRIGAEALRDGAEQQRLLDEATRVSNEQTRELNESGRVTAEQGRVDAEIIREQQEAVRQTNTATAIADAEEATGNANDAAEAANTAATTIDAKIATKAEQADLIQLAGDVSVSQAEQDKSIKDIENILSTSNLNQTAQVSATGASPLPLPKTASNGGMDVKMEGLTEDGLNFVPTGRVRVADKLGKDVSKLYLTAPELRSNGLVKDEIRKGAKGYELVKRVGVATLSAEKVVNGDFAVSTGWVTPDGLWTISDGKARCNSTEPAYIRQNGAMTMGAWQKVKATAAHVRGTSRYITGNAGSNTNLSEGVNSFFVKHIGTSPDVVFIGNNYEGTLDDVSIKELVPQDGAISNTSTFTELSDETILYTLATPQITPIDHAGILNSAESGTVYHEPIVADAGIYSTKIDILQTGFPISEVEEVVKYENGINTYLDASKAVIAPDGLSFTHPDLVSGDLVLFTYEFSKESTNGLITATFYDSRYVIADTANGKHYKWGVKSTNGVATIQLTEV